MMKQTRKLAAIAQALREGTETYFPITCLTSLESLCRDSQVANHFVLYLIEQTREKISTSARPKHVSEADWTQDEALTAEAVAGIRDYLEMPNTENLTALRDLLFRITETQNVHRRQGWNIIRVIRSQDLLVVENGLQCIVSPDMAPYWAYHTARQYTERYDPRYSTGLIPTSAPFLEDIVCFWIEHQTPRYSSSPLARSQDSN